MFLKAAMRKAVQFIMFFVLKIVLTIKMFYFRNEITTDASIKISTEIDTI